MGLASSISITQLLPQAKAAPVVPWPEVTTHGFCPCSDLRGLWIYKLGSRVGINYRLKCLAWTGRQQEPRAWSQGLPTCPCSLQQGQQDPRFKSSRGGKRAHHFPPSSCPNCPFPPPLRGWLGYR